MRIPFDSLCVAAAVAELQPWIGAKAQKWVQVDSRTLAVQLYWRGEGWLWLSWDAEFARLHLGGRPSASIELSVWGQALKSQLNNARLESVRQVGRDRIVDLTFRREEEDWHVIAELMGKHANAMLTDEHGKMVAAAKWLGATKSKRPILPGQSYVEPPVSSSANDFSPFLRDLIEAGAVNTEQALSIFRGTGIHPVQVPILGVYPLPTGFEGESNVASFSKAVSDWYEKCARLREVDQQRSSLVVQLSRVVSARKNAIQELHAASDASARAAEFQLYGELTLAYGFSAPQGATLLEVTDYEGNPLQLPYRPDETPQVNAEHWFKKAKQAKANIDEVRSQLERLAEDLALAETLLNNLEHYDQVEDIVKARAFAEHHRWLHQASSPALKEDRPFAGHRVKELRAPYGYSVFYGENAEANDYLTMRMGKPNDIWMHVRGNVSAHVLIPTMNRPDRVPPEVLRFGAEVSARHSPLKHSSYVPVDYTLKKYVRRPKGAAKGFVSYTHEKTLDVDPTK